VVHEEGRRSVGNELASSPRERGIRHRDAEPGECLVHHLVRDRIRRPFDAGRAGISVGVVTLPT
jgi:hypothetical protein